MDLHAQLTSCKRQLAEINEHCKKSKIAMHEINGQIMLLEWLIAEEQENDDFEI
jgi:hypothetical protein